MGFFIGLLAGFIDSIAGGGGLITLPALSLLIEPGVHAIGTNKIVGSVGAGVAFAVYLSQAKFPWRKGIVFIAFIALGSFVGSRISPWIPREFFKWFLIIASPAILYLIWRRDFLISDKKIEWAQGLSFLILSAFVVGFYDGAFGPGGGTFMFLALVMSGRLSLIESLLVSKLANFGSAGTSLVSYAAMGYVHWSVGLLMASGMALGALFGANLATRHATRIIRPMLTIVVLILLVRLALEQG